MCRFQSAVWPLSVEAIKAIVLADLAMTEVDPAFLSTVKETLKRVLTCGFCRVVDTEADIVGLPKHNSSPRLCATQAQQAVHAIPAAQIMHPTNSAELGLGNLEHSLSAGSKADIAPATDQQTANGTRSTDAYTTTSQAAIQCRYFRDAASGLHSINGPTSSGTGGAGHCVITIDKQTATATPVVAATAAALSNHTSEGPLATTAAPSTSCTGDPQPIQDIRHLACTRKAVKHQAPVASKCYQQVMTTTAVPKAKSYRETLTENNSCSAGRQSFNTQSAPPATALRPKAARPPLPAAAHSGTSHAAAAAVPITANMPSSHTCLARDSPLRPCLGCSAADRAQHHVEVLQHRHHGHWGRPTGLQLSHRAVMHSPYLLLAPSLKASTNPVPAATAAEQPTVAAVATTAMVETPTAVTPTAAATAMVAASSSASDSAALAQQVEHPAVIVQPDSCQLPEAADRSITTASAGPTVESTTANAAAGPQLVAALQQASCTAAAVVKAPCEVGDNQDAGIACTAVPVSHPATTTKSHLPTHPVHTAPRIAPRQLAVTGVVTDCDPVTEQKISSQGYHGDGSGGGHLPDVVDSSKQDSRQGHRWHMQYSLDIQHPTARIFNFLLTSTAALKANLHPHRSQQIPSQCKQPLSDSSRRAHMAPQAEEAYGVPASACHYTVDLPVLDLVAPVLAELLTTVSTQGPHLKTLGSTPTACVKVYDVAAADIFAELDALLQLSAEQQHHLPVVLLLVDPAETREVAAIIRVPPGSLQPVGQSSLAETAAGTTGLRHCNERTAQAAAATDMLHQQDAAESVCQANSCKWLLLDPSGNYENCFDSLSPGPVYFHPLRQVTATNSHQPLAWQQQPGASASHVMFAMASLAGGMLDLASLAQLSSSYSQALSGFHDADFAVSCLASLLVEGRVSIGLLGIELSMAVRYSAASAVAAARESGHMCVARTEADIRVDQMLDAWCQSVSQGRRIAPSTWVDLHDVADVLHHVDGYVSPDGHLLLVSCYNMRSGCWNLASSDISLPLYKQQKVRWLTPISAATHYEADCIDPATAVAAATAVSGTSELILHYSGAHYTISILNHQQKLHLYFDSLGGKGVHSRVVVPQGYETVVLSRPTQNAATCGPQAMFVALAYVADWQQLRSACSTGATVSFSMPAATGSSGLGACGLRTAQHVALGKQKSARTSATPAGAAQRSMNNQNKQHKKGRRDLQSGNKRRKEQKGNKRATKHSRGGRVGSAADVAANAGSDTDSCSSYSNAGSSACLSRKAGPAGSNKNTNTVGGIGTSSCSGLDLTARLHQALAACYTNVNQRSGIPMAQAGALYVDGLVSAAYQVLQQFSSGNV